jgi:hypothetical protein
VNSFSIEREYLHVEDEIIRCEGERSTHFLSFFYFLWTNEKISGVNPTDITTFFLFCQVEERKRGRLVEEWIFLDGDKKLARASTSSPMGFLESMLDVG